tara:strand:+ start:692 stop:2407 length:1716 start_codon:yes stop_codon:yes gene_type:complete
MSTVYDEALLDAKKIREAAERAARDRIMETITPQIREMINNRILSEQDEGDWEDDSEDLDDVEAGDDYDLDSIVDSMPDDVDIGYSEDDAVALADETASASVVVNAAGDVNVYASDEEEDDYMMGEAAAGILAKMVNRDFKSARRMDEKISVLQKRVRKLHDVMTVLREGKLTNQQRKRLEISFITCVKDAVSLQTEVRSSGRGSQHLQAKLNSTIKEMREMSSKYKKNIFDFLFEGDDADSKKELEEQDEVEADAEVLDGGDEEELELDVEDEALEGDVDVVAATDALQDLGSALGLDLEIVDDEGGEEDLEDLEGDEDLEMDFEGGDEELDLEEMAFGGMDEADTVYEIDESVLRKELTKMRKKRKVRESRNADPRRKLRRAVREAAEDEADQFGGAEILGDVIEVDEDTLINVLADELGSVAENRRRQARRPAGRRPNRRNSTVRKAVREAATYKKAAGKLKSQLVEMNLFNAKLLYANKLLQNKGLNVKQQRAIVEALDNAKTLREAKLLYKSLSGSLTRRGRSGKNLSEGKTRTLGSSSRSTQSGQPAKSGVETDRWAVLAGINKA